MNKKIQSTIFLLLTAIIWGFAFVAQRAGMDFVGPFLFSTLRMFIGSLALLPVILIADRLEKNKPVIAHEMTAAEIALSKKSGFDKFYNTHKSLIIGGICCGIVMFFATNFQQVGLMFTTAAKTGFITTLYIVLVPVFGIALKQRVGMNAWIGVAVATVGLYFLCITESFTIAFGDLVVLMGASFWAAHILFIDHFAPKVNVLKLVCFQSFIAGLLSLIVTLFREEIIWNSILQAGPSLLYVGIFSSAVAYTCQAFGQKHANPTAASIILSTESVFAAIGGVLILHEMLSGREWLGCAFMFVAVIVTQLPSKKSKSGNI